MRKILLIVTLSLSAFALARTADNGDMQSSSNDWYNQHLSAQVQQFDQIAAAISPFATSQNGTQPGSMAANVGNSNDDWYNQVLSREVEQSTRTKAMAMPFQQGQGQAQESQQMQ